MRLFPPIAAMLVVAASSGCDPASDTRVVSAEDIRVLRALMNPFCTSGWKQVISDVPIAPIENIAGHGEAANVQFGPGLDSPAAARWPRGDICSSVLVVDDAVVREVLSLETSIPPRWTFFRERFDDARRLTRVSLPVYSADGRSAALYVEGTCPYACGAGFYYELRKAGGDWKVLSSRNASKQ
jgi:hypothetical protein